MSVTLNRKDMIFELFFACQYFASRHMRKMNHEFPFDLKFNQHFHNSNNLSSSSASRNWYTFAILSKLSAFQFLAKVRTWCQNLDPKALDT